MPGQSWQETLINQNVDGPALTNTVTATSLLHATAKLGLPPHFFRIGKMIKITAQGRISTVVTSPGTLTLDVRMGPTANIVVVNGGAMTLNIVAKTNVGWWLEFLMTCRGVGNGTNANLMHQGQWTSEAVIGAPAPTAGGASTHMLPYNTPPAVGTGFDSTVSMLVDLFGTWSTANAANSIQVHQYKLEDLNPSY